MNPIEWQCEAESILASADVEDVRLALFVRLADSYGIMDGVFPVGIQQAIDYKTLPLHEVGVSAKDAQHLAAMKYLEDLAQRASHEQFSWARRYFKQRLKVTYGGSSPLAKFADKLLRITVMRATSRSKVGPVVAESSIQNGIRPAPSLNGAPPTAKPVRPILPHRETALEALGHAVEYALQVGAPATVCAAILIAPLCRLYLQ